MRLVDDAEAGDLATLKPGARVEDANDKELGRVPQAGNVFTAYGRTKARRLAFAWPDGDLKREAYVEPEDVVKVAPKTPGAVDPKALERAAARGFNEGLAAAESVVAGIPERQVPA